MRLCDGYTESGEYVAVDWTGESAYNGYAVSIDGAERSVVGMDLLRDGGTKILKLDGGRRITFPHRMKNTDRIPRLDGERIVES